MNYPLHLVVAKRPFFRALPRAILNPGSTQPYSCPPLPSFFALFRLVQRLGRLAISYMVRHLIRHQASPAVSLLLPDISRTRHPSAGTRDGPWFLLALGWRHRPKTTTFFLRVFGGGGREGASMGSLMCVGLTSVSVWGWGQGGPAGNDRRGERAA